MLVYTMKPFEVIVLPEGIMPRAKKDRNILLNVTAEMKEKLEAEKKRTGAPIVEIIRRAIETYLQGK